MAGGINKTASIIVLIVGIPVLIFCFIGINEQETSYAFRNYQVDVVMTEDKQCQVSEHFLVENNYTGEIKRYLQFCTNVKKPDGTLRRYHLFVSEIDCRVPAEKNIGKFSSVLNIPISVEADPDTGARACRLTYSARMSSDFERDDNQLFLPITGSRHRVDIYGAAFTIEMPIEVPKENIQFCLVQKNGKMEPLNVDFQIDGKIIKGQYDGELKSGTGIAVFMELEDGYFRVPEGDGKYYPLIGGVLVVFMLCTVIWYFFGKEKYALVDAVEFAAPSGMSALELGYFYNGTLTRESTISMFYTLAGKGYINIMKRRNPSTLKPSFVFYKVRNYDGNDLLEKAFIEYIFDKSNVIYSEDMVRESELFGGGLELFHQDASKYLERKYPVYEKGSRAFIVVILLGIAVNYYLAFIRTGENYLLKMEDMMVWQGMEIFFLVIVIGFGIYFVKCRRKRWINALLWFLVAFTFLIINWIPELILDPVHILLYLTGGITLAVELWYVFHFRKLTKSATEMKGRVAGYRKFLQHVESNRINTLFETNKLQYYEVAANAYALKVNWKWFKEIEDVLLPLKDKDEVF